MSIADGGIVMRRTCVIFLAMLLSVILVAPLNSQTVRAEPSTGGWTKTYGGTNWDEAYALVQAGDGGYALAGDTRSYGAGDYDSWLVKTDSAGNALWNKTYGGTGDDGAVDLVQTADGGYALAGDTRSYGAGDYDFWLVKTDVSGNAQWNRTYGGTGNDRAETLVQTADGGYALAGHTTSFGAGDYDSWLVKTDYAGNMQWNKTYGGTNTDSASSMVQTSDGGYALAGWRGGSVLYGSWAWLVKTDSSGSELWSNTYGGSRVDEARSVVQTSDGGYALAGYTYSYGAGNGDFWLVKADSSGKMQWNQTYEGTYNGDEAHSMVQTSDGGYALAGYSDSYGAGESDFWLVKTDENGVIPEFPSFLTLPLFAALTTIAVILAKKRLPKKVDS